MKIELTVVNFSSKEFMCKIQSLCLSHVHPGKLAVILVSKAVSYFTSCNSNAALSNLAIYLFLDLSELFFPT
jgi:hypothetical protein